MGCRRRINGGDESERRDSNRETSSVAKAGLIAVGFLASVASSALAGDISPPSDAKAAAERGRIALTQHGYLQPGWTDSAYEKVGKLWGPDAPDPQSEPEKYARAFETRYGLHPAPFPNDGLPMGLRKGVLSNGEQSGIAVDCMTCHGGSIGGQSYVGLGNTQLDFKFLAQEMNKADGKRLPPTTIVVNSARGTVNAGMFSAILLSIRNSDLSMRKFPLPLGVNLPELDTPPWWNLAKKETMYYDGRTPAASVRTNMQFLLGEKSLEQLKALEPTFRDIQAYFKSLKPPVYPFAIDKVKADRGRAIFTANCQKCHGTYGDKEEYPNVIVPLKEIGTDPARAVGISDRFIAHYNSTWLGQDHPADPEMIGYQAPPLDGVWATAPYLHNGSVPTLDLLLNSSKRPSKFLRPPSTGFENYDQANVGWKFEVVESPKSLTDDQKRAFYDTSRFGLGNGGHLFGDKLNEEQRLDLIEYLKTL